MPETVKGSIFLLSLVTCASMMPVERLPIALWQTAMGLGFVSAVFDNIPLTALALKQGGYDWGMLAYAVGFGGGGLLAGVLYDADPLLPLLVQVALAIPVTASVAVVVTRIVRARAAS